MISDARSTEILSVFVDHLAFVDRWVWLSHSKAWLIAALCGAPSGEGPLGPKLGQPWTQHTNNTDDSHAFRLSLRSVTAFGWKDAAVRTRLAPRTAFRVFRRHGLRLTALRTSMWRQSSVRGADGRAPGGHDEEGEGRSVAIFAQGSNIALRTLK